ncbi:hypothetical protein RUM43_012638 [Polyplax serrata]|uniref:Uncharacterized protein n=1 Tax=Polyplax serrata TaxID=468196 RepID=A0AAN8RYY3_POLSC
MCGGFVFLGVCDKFKSLAEFHKSNSTFNLSSFCEKNVSPSHVLLQVLAGHNYNSPFVVRMSHPGSRSFAKAVCAGVTAFEKGNLADLGHTKILKEHMRNVGKDKSDMSDSEEQDKKRMKF